MSSLIRWEPLERLVSMDDMMDRFFDRSVWRTMGFEPLVGEVAVDMYETKDDVVVKATLPGVKPEDLQVKVEGGILRIDAETRSEEKVEEKNYVRRERRYGKVSRSVALSSDVYADKASAEFEQGILTLKFPKREDVKAKSIQIKVK
jgi:HSP20 family protein